TVLSLEPSGRLELLGRVVDAHHASAPPREPGRPVRGATAQLDDVLAGHVRHDLEVTLGHAPDTPRGIVAGPGAVAATGILHAELVPVCPVEPDVLRQIAVAHGLVAVTLHRDGLDELRSLVVGRGDQR